MLRGCTNFIAIAVSAFVVCSAVTAGLVHSNRPERLHVAIGPAPARPSISEPPTTTEPPPVTTTTTLAPEPAAPTPEVARVQAPPIEQNTSGDPCANPIVPESVAQRESGCRWDAYNPGGCSSRGCIGFYQLDEGHFAAVSPWNPNVSGVCHDLQGVEWEPWAQTECASRLGAGAWG